MKPYNIVLAFLIGTQLISCNLDEQLLDTPNPGLIKDETSLNTLITGMYSMYSDFTFKNGVFRMCNYADDIFVPVNSSNLLRESMRTYDASLLRNELMWNDLFIMINSANYYMEVVQNANVSADFKTRTIGDALFTRAFAYYYLVRLYGGVPIRTASFNLNQEMYLRRSSVDEVYQLILNDFAEASKRLPVLSALNASERGRATGLFNSI